MSDKVNAARAAWALIKLSEIGTRPVSLGQSAEHIRLEPTEALRLLRLTWREQVSIRDGEVRLDTTPLGPRRYRVDAGGRSVAGALGCSVDITPQRVERIDPPTAVVAVKDVDFDITGGPDHTDAEMCAQQPVFASPQAAADWTATHPDGRLIPVRDFHDEARRLVAWLETPPTEDHMTSTTDAAELAEFDQGWLAAMEQTPFVRAIIALSGLTRLGQRPASLPRLAAILDRPLEETAALVRTELTARIENGLIYWDDPYPGKHTRRVVRIGDRAVAMGSGCGPDVFTFAAVFDVPFRVEETCPTTGKLIRVDFAPDGFYQADPPQAVTVLLHPNDFRDAIGGHFAEINANVCTYQPFFASAQAAEPALRARPGARAFTVKQMLERPWFTHYRDTLRPLIHATAIP